MRLNLTGYRHVFAKAVICALLLVTATRPAAASIPTQSDIVWIGIAIGAIGAGIGIGIYYAVHHNHSLTGCVASGAGGLQLESHGDQPAYFLVGDVAGIKPGERVHVSGKKAKAANGAIPQFIVEKLGKDYGACKVSPVAP
jgi:hypothetical protein